MEATKDHDITRVYIAMSDNGLVCGLYTKKEDAMTKVKALNRGLFGNAGFHIESYLLRNTVEEWAKEVAEAITADQKKPKRQ